MPLTPAGETTYPGGGIACILLVGWDCLRRRSGAADGETGRGGRWECGASHTPPQLFRVAALFAGLALGSWRLSALHSSHQAIGRAAFPRVRARDRDTQLRVQPVAVQPALAHAPRSWGGNHAKAPE